MFPKIDGWDYLLNIKTVRIEERVRLWMRRTANVNREDDQNQHGRCGEWILK